MSIGNLEPHNFEVQHVEAWRAALHAHHPVWHDVRRQTLKPPSANGCEKTRLWIAYLAVVSIAFMQGTVGIFQTLASRRVRGPSGSPPTPCRSLPVSFCGSIWLHPDLAGTLQMLESKDH